MQFSLIGILFQNDLSKLIYWHFYRTLSDHHDLHEEWDESLIFPMLPYRVDVLVETADDDKHFDSNEIQFMCAFLEW